MRRCSWTRRGAWTAAVCGPAPEPPLEWCLSVPKPVAIKAAPGIRLLQQEGLNTGYLAFNTLQKPFDDPRVRKAIDMAITALGLA